MNINKQLLKIIKDNTITENVITISNHIEQENSFEVLCNHGFVVSQIKQSILKAIMEKSLKTTESHDNCSCNQCMYVRFRNRNLEEFESVIKEILGGKE